MKLWDELTLKQQIKWADWDHDPGTRVRPPSLSDRRSKDRLEASRIRHGWGGLTSKWVQWCNDNPDRLVEAVEAYNQSYPHPIQWYPRPGDWVVFTQDRGVAQGVYRSACSGQVVQVVGCVDRQTEDGEYIAAHQVEGLWDGFGVPELVTWCAYRGELRPATPEERTQAALTRQADL